MPLYSDFEIFGPTITPPTADGIQTTFISHMHQVLRRSPAPVMRELFGAITQAWVRLYPSAAINMAFLHRSRGAWLDMWGSMFSLPRNGGELDDAYKQRLLGASPGQSVLHLKRHVDTASLKARIELNTGYLPTLEFGTSRVAFDDQITTYLDAGTPTDIWTADPDPGKYISPQKYDWGGPYAEAGIIIWMPVAYSANIETLLLQVLQNSLAAGISVDINWDPTIPGGP